MSADAGADPNTEGGGSTVARPGGPLAGRAGLVLAGLMALLGVYLTVGVVTMDVPEGSESPGPTFFPTLLAVACFVLAVALVVQLVRHPEPPTADEALDEYGGQHRTFSDFRALGITVVGFLAFALLLEPLGWILSAALLFWSIAFAMGSRRGLVDVAVALTLSCAVQVAFSAGLGLSLPGGPLEGIL